MVNKLCSCFNLLISDEEIERGVCDNCTLKQNEKKLSEEITYNPIELIEKAKQEVDGEDKSIFMANPEGIINCVKEKVEGKKKKKEEEKISRVIYRFVNKIDLAEQFIEIMPLYYDKFCIWWRFNNSRCCWEMIDEIDILNLVEGSSGANIINSKERTEILNALRQRARRNKPEELKPTCLQFKDEIIDLETGERFKSTPKYFAINPIDYKIGKTEETPVMDKIFSEWVGEANRKKLYQIIAFCISPDYFIHRMFYLVGAGRNGKGCYLRLIEKLLGKNNICSTELEVLLNSRFETAKLYRKLVCMMGETDFGLLKHTSRLKRLTGEDLIPAEFKNKTPFDFYNYAKILIATNNLPETNDKTDGFYSRPLIIDFPNRFSEKIDILATIPEVEYENLALKSIKILIELLEKREFDNEGTIEQRKQKYEDTSNPFDKFYNECIIEEFEGYIFKFEFEKRFNEWCKENRFREHTETSIARKMKEKGIYDCRKMSSWLIDGQNKQLRCWSGIRWKI